MAKNKSRAKFMPTLAGFKSWLLLVAVGAMIGVMPMMGQFLSNRYEASVLYLVLPVLSVIVVAMVIAGVFYGYYRRQALGGFVATVVAALLLTNNYDSRLSDIYPVIGALVPLPKLDGAEASIFNLIFMLIIFLGAWGAGRLVEWFWARRHWPTRDVVGGGVVAITVSFVLLAVPTIKVMASAWPQYFYKPPKLVANLKTNDAKPDIYYIVLDRYASQSVLKSQFNYSNDDFINYLTAAGYTTNPDSHQNYPYTTQSISSTLNAGYNADAINQFDQASSQTIVPYHQSIKYAGVTQALKSAGYQFDQIGTWYEASNQAPLADNFYLQDRTLTLFGKSTHISGLTLGLLADTPLWRFMKSGLKIGGFSVAGYQSQTQVEMTQYSLDTLKSLASQPAGGRFIFAHLLIPHDPYYFNADGSISDTPASDNSGKPIKQKYLGQVQYINGQMKQILDQIKTTSQGKAVVVLQADEGPYPIQLNDEDFDQDNVTEEINNLDMRTWSDTNLAMKYGNLAAYYIPQAKTGDLAAGANNLNVFRLIFNNYFGTSMNYLPECYYAYPNGRSQPMVYSDITARLTGAANPVCANNGTGPK